MHGAGGGAPPGNKNALKHGLYSAEAVANATGDPLAFYARAENCWSISQRRIKPGQWQLTKH
jgi:hypothetical protein